MPDFRNIDWSEYDGSSPQRAIPSSVLLHPDNLEDNKAFLLIQRVIHNQCWIVSRRHTQDAGKPGGDANQQAGVIQLQCERGYSMSFPHASIQVCVRDATCLAATREVENALGIEGNYTKWWWPSELRSEYDNRRRFTRPHLDEQVPLGTSLCFSLLPDQLVQPMIHGQGSKPRRPKAMQGHMVVPSPRKWDEVWGTAEFIRLWHNSQSVAVPKLIQLQFTWAGMPWDSGFTQFMKSHYPDLRFSDMPPSFIAACYVQMCTWLHDRALSSSGAVFSVWKEDLPPIDPTRRHTMERSDGVRCTVSSLKQVPWPCTRKRELEQPKSVSFATTGSWGTPGAGLPSGRLGQALPPPKRSSHGPSAVPRKKWTPEEEMETLRSFTGWVPSDEEGDADPPPPPSADLAKQPVQTVSCLLYTSPSPRDS